MSVNSPSSSPVAGARPATTALHRRSWLARFLDGPWPWLLPGLLMLTVFRVYPVFSQFQISLTDLNVSDLDGARYIGLDNYEFLINDKVFLDSLGFTFIFTVAGVIGQFVIGFALALLLDRPLFGRTFFRLAIMSSWVISSLIVGYIWRLMLGEGRAGVLNAWLVEYGHEPMTWLSDPQNARISVIMVNIWRSVAYTMVFMLAGLQTVPQDMIEAATVDGANVFQRLIRIKVPFMRALIALNVIFITIATFNVYEQILIITGGGPGGATETVAYNMYITAFGSYASGSLGQLGRAAAMGNIMFFITLVFTLIYLWLTLFRQED